jgi:hypothetical protein
MSMTDAFALTNSGLNAFLFAEVGTELNGSKLTMLSVLARMDQDPWTEAARWAGRPTADIVNFVAASIEKMPLYPRDLRDSRLTAVRLSRLLPGQEVALQPVETAPKQPGAIVASLPRQSLMILYCVVTLALLVNMALTARHGGGRDVTVQPTEHPVGAAG